MHGLAVHWYNNVIISPERAIRRSFTKKTGSERKNNYYNYNHKFVYRRNSPSSGGRSIKCQRWKGERIGVDCVAWESGSQHWL